MSIAENADMDQGVVVDPPKKVELKATWIKFNADGSLRHPLRTFIRLMFSDDNMMPSSTRVIGTWIFGFVSVAVGVLTGVLALKLHGATDARIVESCMVGVKTLLWIYTTMLATAMSMYGIHVWKYIAQIQAGLFMPPIGMGMGSGYGQQYGQYSQGQYGQQQYGSTGLPAFKPPVPVPADPPTPAPAPKKTVVAGVGNDD
jgi:hypothetical protein